METVMADAGLRAMEAVMAAEDDNEKNPPLMVHIRYGEINF
jgi:hypothetical protein